MRIRRNFLPRILRDIAVTSFVSIMIPLVYWFELYIVLPTIYTYGTAWYTIHFILGNFIMFNVTSNYLSAIVCETGIKGVVMPASLQPNWRFCACCESVAPPRSWHCEICKMCVLKRDHHCIFTGCCIGHLNFRYFYIFVFYIFIATLYATFYNIFFIYEAVDLHSYWTIVKVLFPLSMVFFDRSWNQIYLFLILIEIFFCAFAGVLLYLHTLQMCKGVVTYEQKHNLNPYDLGWKENVRTTLGKKWFLTWISPFLESELTHNGIDWIEKEDSKRK